MTIVIAANSALAHTQPAVGIFWRVDGILVIDRSTLEYAEAYGDCITYAAWNYELRNCDDTYFNPHFRGLRCLASVVTSITFFVPEFRNSDDTSLYCPPKVRQSNWSDSAC